MKQTTANVIDEYGPFTGVDAVHGVSYDGQKIWFASGDKLHTIDPASGKQVTSIDVTANAGTAYDGQHLYQIADDHIQKIDPNSGEYLPVSLPPRGAAPGSPGLRAASG